MYAVVESGGKQFRVEIGEEIDVELLHQAEGEEIEFAKVLLVEIDGQIQVGSPFLAEAHVKALVLGEALGEKVFAFKYKRRTNERTKKGHRQHYTRVRITEIAL